MSGFARQDKDKAAYRQNPTTGKWERCVADVDTHDKLDTLISAENATTPKIYNIVVPTANTEVSQVLSANVKKYLIRVEDGKATIQLAYITTESGTNYITVPKNSSKTVDGISSPTLTLYFQLDIAGKTVQIEEWT